MDCNLDDIAKEFLDGLDPLPFCSDLLGDGSLGLSALQQNSADPQPGGPRWSSFCQAPQNDGPVAGSGAVGGSGQYADAPPPLTAECTASLASTPWQMIQAAAQDNNAVRGASPSSSSSGGQHGGRQRRASQRAAQFKAGAARLQKSQETHRRAQQRYRVRQKDKLATAEIRVAELTQQLEQLQSEKEALIVERQASSTATSLSPRSAETQLQDADSECRWLDASTRRFLFSGLQADGGEIIITVDSLAPKRMSHQQLMQLSPPQVGELWRRYMNGYAECLIQASCDLQSPAGLRLERLAYEGGQLWASVLAGHPDKVKEALKYMTTADDDAHRPHRTMSPAAEDVWLAGAANFTPQQKEVLCALRVPFYCNLGQLKARRDALSARLQTALPLPQGAAMAQGAAPESGSRFEAAESVMDALKATMRDEHCCYAKASMMLWRRILTCFQGAFLNVQAYPRGVRIFAILEVVAEAAGGTSMQQLLERGAKEPDAQLLPLEDVLPPSMREEQVPPPDAGLAGSQDAAASLPK